MADDDGMGDVQRFRDEMRGMGFGGFVDGMSDDQVRAVMEEARRATRTFHVDVSVGDGPRLPFARLSATPLDGDSEALDCSLDARYLDVVGGGVDEDAPVLLDALADRARAYARWFRGVPDPPAGGSPRDLLACMVPLADALDDPVGHDEARNRLLDLARRLVDVLERA